MPAAKWLAVAAQLCGLAVHAAAGHICPGFDNKGLQAYRTPSTSAQGNQDWLAVKASLYGSSSSFLSNTSTSTWSECAGNCSSKPPCFVFNWCSNPFGCCNVTAGCQADDLQSYGTCLLKAQATVSPVYSDSLPDLVYDSSIAQGWDAPGNRRQGISSSAHAFDSGMVVNQTMDEDGFCQVPGADVKEGNFVCPGIGTGTGVVQSTYSQDLATSCHVTGNLTAVADACYANKNCSAFIFQPNGCCARPNPAASAWLKAGAITPDLAIAMPLSTLYIKTGSVRQAPPRPAPPRSHTETGPIIGGVVGGTVFAVILAAVSLAVIVKLRTGHWLFTRKQPGDGDGDHFSDELGTMVLMKNAFNSKGSSRSRSSTGSSSLVESMDATTLINQMQGASWKSGPGWKIRAEEISIVKRPDGRDHKLGEGGFGCVYLGLRDGVDQVAIKVLKGKQDSRMQTAFAREIEILSNARHPAILQYIGCCMRGNHTFLVTEYMDGGDLWTALSQPDSQYLWYSRGQHVALSIAKALQYLHSREQVVLHLDLKSQNVLLSRTGEAKLADVGLARVLKGGDYTQSADPGTWAYASPEVLMGSACGPKADVWSYGVLLWEICVGEVPQRGNLRAVRVPEECPEAVDDLIWRCMAETHARPTTRELVTLLTKLVTPYSV